MRHACRKCSARAARPPAAVVVAVCAALAVLVLSGCSVGQQAARLPVLVDSALLPPDGPAPTAIASRRPRVALVMKTLTNPFFVDMERGARQAEADAGIELIVRTGSEETSIDEQIAIIEDLTRQRVDAIVITPGGSTELIPALARARQAGIMIVNIDNRLDPALSQDMGLAPVAFVGVDNELAAYRAASVLVRRMQGSGEVAILEGIRSADTAQRRLAGARRAFGEAPDIKIVASTTANWKIDESYAATRTILSAHPGVRAIYACNDMMALGALRYLQEVGRDDVLVAGFDALEPARRALAGGQFVATVDQQAQRQGYMGVQYAIRSLAGESLPSETLVDAVVLEAQP